MKTKRFQIQYLSPDSSDEDGYIIVKAVSEKEAEKAFYLDHPYHTILDIHEL